MVIIEIDGQIGGSKGSAEHSVKNETSFRAFAIIKIKLISCTIKPQNGNDTHIVGLSFLVFKWWVRILNCKWFCYYYTSRSGLGKTLGDKEYWHILSCEYKPVLSASVCKNSVVCLLYINITWLTFSIQFLRHLSFSRHRKT